MRANAIALALTYFSRSTMYYRICVQPAGRAGTEGENSGLVHDAASLGVTLTGIRMSTLYFVRGDVSPQQVDVLCAALFADPVTEIASWETVAVPPDPGPRRSLPWVVEVGLHPGVTDPVANQIVHAATVLDMPPLQAATGRRFELAGDLDETAVRLIARSLLCNETIESYFLGPMTPAFLQPAPSAPATSHITLTGLSADDLLSLSRRRLAGA